MADVQNELNALHAIQTDFENIKNLKQKINALDNKIASVDKECKEAKMPKKPVIDHAESERLKKDMAQTTNQTGGGYAAGFTFCVLAVAIIGLFIGSGWNKLWSVLAAGCVWVFCCFGPITAVIGCGLGALIGWNTWAGAGIVWQIVLILLAVVSIVMAYFCRREDKKMKPLLEQKQREIDNRIKAEEAAWEEKMAEYNNKLATFEDDYLALSRKVNKELFDKRDTLQAQLRAAETRIADNPVLDNSDKTEEVIDYVVSLLQRKRAVSLTDALQQYDAMVKQRDQARFDREMRQLQMDMDRMHRDEQIRREADAQWNQAMHNLRVEKEQRRQTKILQEINENMEK